MRLRVAGIVLAVLVLVVLALVLFKKKDEAPPRTTARTEDTPRRTATTPSRGKPSDPDEPRALPRSSPRRGRVGGTVVDAVSREPVSRIDVIFAGREGE